MFHPELPAELALLILSYLPLSAIGYLRRVNREWSYFVEQNLTTVYRNAAFLEGFIAKKHTLLSELDGSVNGTMIENGNGGPCRTWDGQGTVGHEHKQGPYSRKALRGVNSWETLCKRQKLIHRSWSGHAPSRVVSSPRVLPSPLSLNTPENSHYRRVHRIKVDEQVGITLATTELGGLVVRDIETDEVLWELPIWYVHSHAHLEYERGYIIFDRTDGGKEVWRRTRDIEADEARRRSRRPPSSNSQSEDVSASAPDEPAGDESQEEAPRPKPDQRQLHVASYLHTLAVAFVAAAASPSTPTSPTSPTSPTAPSHPSLSASSYVALSTPSWPDPKTNPNYRTSNGHTSKAHFTPFAVLHLPAPETSRAFRFVYPHLLVAAMDRAYVFDVPQGRVVQVIQGVQRIRRVRVPEEEGEEHAKNDTGEGCAVARTPRAGSPIAPGPEDAGVSEDAGNAPNENEHLDQEEDEEDEDEDEDDPASAQFLGQIRYVEISPRHVFIAGRNVLQVFSRETGKCVMNMSSTRGRYGAWAWGVEDRSGARAAASGVDGDKGKQKAGAPVGPADTYDAARGEEREAVRVPLRFTFQSETRDDRMIIDQFVAVHASRDGRHFVALLSGARLIVVHHFEALLARHRVPPRAIRRHPPHHPNSSIRDRSMRYRDKMLAKAMDKATQYAAQVARDKDLFMHTMDIRLGSPRVTDSVYLAYEHGRIGVVTRNAVYIVHPTPPSPPSPLPSLRTTKTSPSSSSSLSLPTQITYPYPPPPPLRISRLPYFVNPSWLGAVTCLMMSDTGLYLNWNPTAPVSSPGQNRFGYRFGTVFGTQGGPVALGGGGPHFGMADQGEEDEDQDEDEELDDEEEVWMDEGDNWDEVDGYEEGGGGLGVGWDQNHLPVDNNDDDEDTADAIMDDGSLDANGGDTVDPSSSLAPNSAHDYRENVEDMHQHAEGEMPEGYLAVELPSQHVRDIFHRRTGLTTEEGEGNAERDEEYRRIWEAEYQRDLRDMDAYEDDWYQALPNGDMFVAPNPRPIEVSEVSTVFSVEFIPEINV